MNVLPRWLLSLGLHTALTSDGPMPNLGTSIVWTSLRVWSSYMLPKIHRVHPFLKHLSSENLAVAWPKKQETTCFVCLRHPGLKKETHILQFRFYPTNCYVLDVSCFSNLYIFRMRPNNYTLGSSCFVSEVSGDAKTWGPVVILHHLAMDLALPTWCLDPFGILQELDEATDFCMNVSQTTSFHNLFWLIHFVYIIQNPMFRCPCYHGCVVWAGNCSPFVILLRKKSLLQRGRQVSLPFKAW